MRVAFAFDSARFLREMDAQVDRLTRQARRATNELAWRAREAIKEDMWTRAFDRPTPYILNSMRIEPATDEGAPAVIDWIAGVTRRNDPREILRPQIEGGGRAIKRFEELLGLSGEMRAVPGAGARRDRYGNVSGGQITKILSDLRLFNEVGFQANRSRTNPSRGARRQEHYFIIRNARAGGLPAGVYLRRANGNPLLVFLFVRSVSYRVRFAPAEIARQVVRRESADVWALAVQGRLPFRQLNRAGATTMAFRNAPTARQAYAAAGGR